MIRSLENVPHGVNAPLYRAALERAPARSVCRIAAAWRKRPPSRLRRYGVASA